MFRLILTLMCCVPAVVAAGTVQPYDPEKFNALNHDGGVVVLAFGAGWCPTCQVQEATIESLVAEDEFKDVQVLAVDFSAQKDAVRQFEVAREATLVLFHGETEVARSWLAVTTHQIRNFLRQALD